MPFTKEKDQEILQLMHDIEVINFPAYQQLLEDTKKLKTELKRRCMIFQYEEKMYLAEFFGIDKTKMEELSYLAYVEVEEAFRKLKVKAEQEFHKQNGPDTSILLGAIWLKYAIAHESEWQEIKDIIKKDLDIK
jgi:hypothetical protein